MSALSVEHLRSYLLEKTRTVKVQEPAGLSVMFPFTPYRFGVKSIETETLHFCYIDCQHNVDMSWLEQKYSSTLMLPAPDLGVIWASSKSYTG